MELVVKYGMKNDYLIFFPASFIKRPVTFPAFDISLFIIDLIFLCTWVIFGLLLIHLSIHTPKPWVFLSKNTSLCHLLWNVEDISKCLKSDTVMTQVPVSQLQKEKHHHNHRMRPLLAPALSVSSPPITTVETPLGLKAQRWHKRKMDLDQQAAAGENHLLANTS